MYQNKELFDTLVTNEVKRLNNEIRCFDTYEAHAATNNRLATRTLTKKLQTWYQQHHPGVGAVNELLQILIGEGIDVPFDVNDLLSSSSDTEQIETPNNDDMDMDAANEFPHTALDSWNTNVEQFRSIKKENYKDSSAVIKNLQEQQRHINAKLNYMIREIAKANVKINENAGIEIEVEKSTTIFPIENVTDLAHFEKALDETNTGTYILTVKKIIKNDNLNKSLLRILSKDILLEHNLDGRQKKLALNAYPKLLNMIFRSYETYESFPEFTWDLKHAMKRIKNRFHKMNCINRKTTLNPLADPLLVNLKGIKEPKPDDDDDTYF